MSRLFMTAPVAQQNRARSDGSLCDGLEEARRELIQSNSTAARIVAVQTLKRSRSDLAIASLVAAMFDDDADVRQAAVDALSHIPTSGISSESLEVLFGDHARSGKSSEHTANSVELDLDRELSRAEKLAIIASDFDDQSPAVRNAAALALHELDPDKSARLFESMLESAAPDRRERIADAIVDSGLAAQAIDDLTDGRSGGHAALSLLFLIGKLDALEPLLQGIEHHPHPQVRRALVKLLTLNGRSDLAESAARRRLGIPVQTPTFSPTHSL